MKLSKIIARADKLGRHWHIAIEKHGCIQCAISTTDENPGREVKDRTAKAEFDALDPAALEALDKARPCYELGVKGWIARVYVQMGDTLFFDCRKYRLPAKRCEIGF